MKRDEYLVFIQDLHIKKAALQDAANAVNELIYSLQRAIDSGAISDPVPTEALEKSA